MRQSAPEHSLEFLLAFDGRRHWYEGGYYVKFEIKRVRPTSRRPHGLRYSFTLHDPSGNRLVGFDNAHLVPVKGSRLKRKPVEADHWHRTGKDPGRPY
ncbi:MAG: toxin-antitoxin system TumE family protein, partial [Alphaproteobacteria bacterium]